MFIYKITVGDKVYIGLDSKPEYKESRWKRHYQTAKYAKVSATKGKLLPAMKKHGVDNCTYEVIERGFNKMIDLALAEIKWIKHYNSYRKGLNASPGGDGIGQHSLSTMSEESIKVLRDALGEHWTAYNKKKWGGLTTEERKKETAHLHTTEVYEKKANTLKKFYEANPHLKKGKAESIKKWREQNNESFKAMNKKNGLIGAAKVSKQVVVEWENGKGETFKSRSEFERQTGLWFSTLIAKSSRGEYYKGYKLKDDK